MEGVNIFRLTTMVSEELSSVETSVTSYMTYRNRYVSEELSSVETRLVRHREARGRIVSEELNSVET